MRVEFVKEIHDGVGLEGRAADHDVFFALRSMRRVRAAELLPFHPRERELLELWKRDADNLNFVSEGGGWWLTRGKREGGYISIGEGDEVCVWWLR